MASIRLSGLAHSYLENPSQPEDFAIQSLEHEFKQGGAYALLGPSGCGKSTLLNIISGLLTPSDGEVLFDEEPVTQLSTAERNIAQVFQFPVVYDSMTVAQNLAFPLKNMKLPKTEVDAKVTEIAGLLEIEEILNKKAQNLSADQKQKVSMARGLVRENVSAILFDEPLTVIDPHLKWKLRRKLKQIHEQLNITMLYVTHDQLEAATFADEIAVMYQGKIVQFGPPQDLFERPNHTFVGYFIGSPGMNFIKVPDKERHPVSEALLSSLTDEQSAMIEENIDSRVELGIRPEFVEVVDAAFTNSLAAEFVAIEDLGAYQILTVLLDGHEIKVRVNEHWQHDGGVVHVHFPKEWLKLYINDYLVEHQGGSANE